MKEFLFCLALVMLGTGTAMAETCDQQTIEHNKELIRIIASADHRDRAALIDATNKVMADTYIQHNVLITGKEYQGREGYLHAVDRLLKLNADPNFGKRDIILANCNYVASMRRLMRFDPQHPGKIYETDWFDLWRVENGKLAEHWDQSLKDADSHRAEVDLLNPRYLK